MKRTLLFVVVLGLLASPVAARQWTSRAGGFSVEAELVDVKDGKVILKKTDGTQISVPLNKLSLGDMQYINGVLKSAEAGIYGHEVRNRRLLLRKSRRAKRRPRPQNRPPSMPPR